MFEVLMMDSTYKTNQYKMQLLEIVGQPSTKMTYNVGFALLTSEKKDIFTWAVQKFVIMLK